VHHEVHHPKSHTHPPRQHDVAVSVPAPHVLPHEVKGFLEGGIAAIVAGVSTHPLDLIKVRMQVQFHASMPLPHLERSTKAGYYSTSGSTVLHCTVMQHQVPLIGMTGCTVKCIEYCTHVQYSCECYVQQQYKTEHYTFRCLHHPAGWYRHLKV